MLIFSKEQKKFHIGNVKIGGQIGELPVVLVGAIFFQRDPIVTDPIKGIFNKKVAEDLLHNQAMLSVKTGNPYMTDITGLTPEAINCYIDFVASITDAPIVLDGISLNTKISGLKYAAEVGLIDRIVYNSISNYTTEEELAAIEATGVKSAILLAYDPHFSGKEGRISALVGGLGKKGLLARAAKAKIENVLVDTIITNMSSIGTAADAIKLVKEEIGLPAGAAPCNAVIPWIKNAEFADAKNISYVIAATFLQSSGANFLIYGPLKRAEVVFNSCAIVNAFLANAIDGH